MGTMDLMQALETLLMQSGPLYDEMRKTPDDASLGNLQGSLEQALAVTAELRTRKL